MRLDTVCAQNFLSHRDTSISVEAAQRYQVAGENGAGKTSIAVDAPLWALFGQSRGGTTEQLKGPWGDRMLVSVTFAVRGKEYRVQRTRGASGSLTLENLTDGLDLTEKHIAMTQTKIGELIGTFGSFVNTAIFRQGDALRFATMRPEERRSLFEELLNLEVFADIETVARRRRVEAERTVEHMSERSRRIVEAEAQIGGCRADLLVVRSRIDDVETERGVAQAALDDATRDLVGMDALQRQKQQVIDDAFSAEREWLAAKASADQFTATVERRIQELERVSRQICPTCGQLIDSATTQQRTEELQAEIATAGERLKMANERVEATYAALLDARSQVTVAAQQVEAKFQSARDRHAQLSSQLPGLDQTLRELRSMEGALTGSIETLETSIADKALVTQSLQTAQHEIRGFSLIAEAFSKRGIPRELMRGFANELEKAANALLSGLTTMTIRIALDKDGATKSGVTEGTVELWVADQGGERKVEMLSGGEKMRVMLALRLGIAQVRARRSDRAIRTLILDESLDGLDTAGRDAAMAMLQSFTSSAFDRMLFVTHDPAVAGMFPDRLTLAKMSDGSSALL